MEFNLRCKETMPEYSSVGMMDRDGPNVPDKRPSPTPGLSAPDSMRLDKRSSRKGPRDCDGVHQGACGLIPEALA
ncbi:hypothetical protein AtEden1_Chr5g0116311 [Arabidopsis thaliana]